MIFCGDDIRISIGLANECVTPNGVLRGEVIITVSPSRRDGVSYRRISLELNGVEHNAVRDDQGEFDGLLDDYTADRTYLARHVTLSGKKKAYEEAETAQQQRQEVMFRQHHTSPYYRVVPEKRREPTPPKKRKGKKGDHGNDDGDGDGDGAPANDRRGSPAEIEMREGGLHGHGNEDPAWTDLGAAADSTDRLVPAPVVVAPPTVMALERLGGGEQQPYGDGPERGPAVTPPPAAAAAAVGGEGPQQRHANGAARQRRSAKEHRLMPGRYTFPFSFRVPAWMPPSLYYSIAEASGNITYTARAKIEFGLGTRNIESSKRFYVLSAISSRQLIASHEEAIAAATTAPLPPLSALFQVFACSFLGNLCCLASHSAIEVEVALQSSRALVLSDANATYQVFREYLERRDERDKGDGEDEALAAAAAAGATGPGDGVVPGRLLSSDSPSTAVQAFRGYDAFMERKYMAPGEGDFVSPAAFVDRFLRTQQRDRDGPHSDGEADVAAKKTPASGKDGALEGELGVVDVGEAEETAAGARAAARAKRAAARHEAKQEALRERRAAVERALPLPIGELPLLVRVHNACQRREIKKVRVELRETIQIFKSLEMPRVFPHALARYDYTVPIPPGEEVTFAARLQLPKQFRRCKEDDHKLCPPPGVKTANITTATVIAVSFPGLVTYVEEEDWVNGVVQLAEAVDSTDEVLDLPTRYS